MNDTLRKAVSTVETSPETVSFICTTEHIRQLVPVRTRMISLTEQQARQIIAHMRINAPSAEEVFGKLLDDAIVAILYEKTPE